MILRSAEYPLLQLKSGGPAELQAVELFCLLLDLFIPFSGSGSDSFSLISFPFSLFKLKEGTITNNKYLVASHPVSGILEFLPNVSYILGVLLFCETLLIKTV